MHVANHAAKRDHELEVAHVLEGVTGGGNVIRHQVEARDGEHDEKKEREAAQAKGVRHPDPGAALNRADARGEHREGRRDRERMPNGGCLERSERVGGDEAAPVQNPPS